jgi:drug/metabolite transporter superfamily protein YnfA
MLVGLVAIVGFAIWGWFTFLHGSSGSAKFVAAACGRIALLMASLWLAWSSLQRPARWLPPGFAMMLIVALAILAARPRLIVVAIPALGVLLAIATVLRFLKP